MPTRFGVVRRPEEVSDLVARNLAASLSAKVQREPELQFGLGRQPDSTRVDLGLAKYATSYG